MDKLVLLHSSLEEKYQMLDQDHKNCKEII